MNRVIEPKPSVRIPFFLQSSQFLQPPRLVPVHLLHRLVAVCIINVGVELAIGLACVKCVSHLTTVLGRYGVVGGRRGVEG